MRILVTGATGFVGRHLVPELQSVGHQVLSVVRSDSSSTHMINSYVLKDDQDDFRDKVIEFAPEVCLHLAAFLTSADDYVSMQKLISSNILLTCRLLDVVKDVNELKLFVNTGTFAEYFQGDHHLDPAYLYAASKTAARSFLKYYSTAYHFKAVTVVPYTIYGGTTKQEKIIDHIFNSLDALKPVELTNGEQVLDFIHMNDVINFYQCLVDRSEMVPEEANFYLGTGKGCNLRQLAALMEDFTGQRANIKWGAREYREKDTFYSVANIGLQYRLWKWLPKVTLREGIAQYIKSNMYASQ